MKRIKLTKNQYAIIDDYLFDEINSFKWYAQQSITKSNINYYAVRSYSVDGKQKQQAMHTYIILKKHGEVPAGMEIDHKDTYSLNNMYSNLRFCTHADNLKNRRSKTNGSSRYKGVDLYKKTMKWRAQITNNNIKIHLGYYDTEVEAAVSYNAKAKELFGKFKKNNVIFENKSLFAEFSLN